MGTVLGDYRRLARGDVVAFHEQGQDPIEASRQGVGRGRHLPPHRLGVSDELAVALTDPTEFVAVRARVDRVRTDTSAQRSQLSIVCRGGLLTPPVRGCRDAGRSERCGQISPSTRGPMIYEARQSHPAQGIGGRREIGRRQTSGPRILGEYERAGVEAIVVRLENNGESASLPTRYRDDVAALESVQ